MKKVVLLAFVLVLLSTGAIVRFVRPVVADGTIFIRADGSIDPPGANITSVNNITYYFTDNINESIYVERDNIVVDGAGYTLQGTGSGTGIYLSYRSNVTIKNIRIKNFGYGIYLYESSNNIISGNNITGGGIYLDSSNSNSISANTVTRSGIGLSSSSNNTISENIINNGRNGITLYVSSNNVLRSNSMYNNKYNFWVWGGSLSHFVNDVDASNTVDGKPVYYWINERDMDIPLDAGYVALVNCTSITVESLNLANNGQGILLASTTNSTITKNNITNNGKYVPPTFKPPHMSGGVTLRFSSYNTIAGNNITNNDDGILLKDSSSNLVYGNNITNNDLEGIYLYESSSNRISENNITNNHYRGISLGDSSNNNITRNNITNDSEGIVLFRSSEHNSIYGNNITANGDAGITLWSSSDDNTISENNIANNGVGIWLHMDSSNNIIYHNNFINNTQQVYDYSWDDAYDLPSINVWDDGYPSGGNYWSDYNGKDRNGDGIGDTPYVIDENNQDNYPLMSPLGLVEEEEEIPFWTQWWFWAIAIAGIAVLAGAVYFFKKRKPPTPTAPPLPTEGTLQNIHRAYSCHAQPTGTVCSSKTPTITSVKSFFIAVQPPVSRAYTAHIHRRR